MKKAATLIPLKRVTSVPRLPRRPRDLHKGGAGTVLVVAGSEAMLGAAILCARGAQRGGAGLVRAALPRELRAPFTVAVPTATTLPRAYASDVARSLAGANAIVAGPGLGVGAGTKSLVAALVRHANVPIVFDADALNALAPLRRAMSLRAGAKVVVTPHPGEAARLLGTTTAKIQADRAAAVRELAVRCRGVAVLKGAGTLVCDGTLLYENRTGNPGMATGGSGDVLSGLLGALLAQGMAPFEAACLAAYAHGRAGDLCARRIAPVGFTAEDIAHYTAEALR